MFGEMLGIWFMTAIRNNYTPPDLQESTDLPPLGNLNTMNLVEIGPGSGIMMSDILRVILPNFINLDFKSIHWES